MIKWLKDLFGREVLKKEILPPKPEKNSKKREVGYIVTLSDGVTQHYTEYPENFEEERKIRAATINKIEEFRKIISSTTDEYVGFEGFVFKKANFKNISIFVRGKEDEK